MGAPPNVHCSRPGYAGRFQTPRTHNARRLWQYAITQKEQHPVQVDQVDWRGDIGLWKKKRRAGEVRYDFVQQGTEGQLHVYLRRDGGRHPRAVETVDRGKEAMR